MPATIRSEFTLALNQVAAERSIEPSIIIEGIKAAIMAAYKKDVPVTEEDVIDVQLNPDTGEARVMKNDKDVTPPGFGRIAAQTAKQVILQKVREAEKQTVLADFQAKVGTIVSGMILRFDGPNIIVDIGRTQAVMPPSEQSHGEHYTLNQRLSFYIEGIRESMRGSEIVVSRTNKGLVEGLFRREVPEVAQGSVELRVVAREAGRRTKIAVFSSQPGVDPVGSCVGQKGVRVQAVINELGGSEKVDIIQWNNEPVQFIISALAPATDISVELHKKTLSAVVSLPEDQLSLAIGRDGQNVRLASKLTGWKIDIKGKEIKEIIPEKTKEVTEKPQEIEGSVSLDEKENNAKPSKKATTKKSTKKNVKEQSDGQE